MKGALLGWIVGTAICLAFFLWQPALVGALAGLVAAILVSKL